MQKHWHNKIRLKDVEDVEDVHVVEQESLSVEHFLVAVLLHFVGNNPYQEKL